VVMVFRCNVPRWARVFDDDDDYDLYNMQLFIRNDYVL